MAIIGYSFWGHINPDEISPDGQKYSRWQLINEFLNRGHQVICLQKNRDGDFFNKENWDKLLPHMRRIAENVTWDSTGFPDIDILFAEHRWRMFPNQTDHIRQEELFAHYGNNPDVVMFDWDLDHNLKKDTEAAYPNMIIAEPSETPLAITRKRYIWHYAADHNAVNDVKSNPDFDKLMSYVGNNYHRDKQFLKYISRPADEFPGEVYVYGNWVKNSKHSTSMREASTNVNFQPPCSQSAIKGIYNTSGCTFFIGKDSYAKARFITLRLLEGIHYRTIVLAPKEYGDMSKFILPENQVDGTAGAIARLKEIKNMTASEREDVIERQLQLVAWMNPKSMVDQLFEIIEDSTGKTF